jgi:GNAT superfamily N-acetyltransferase
MKMVEMNAEGYRVFRKASLEGYATDISKQHEVSIDQARRDAEASFATLLPKEQATENNYFYNLVGDDNGLLGYIWFQAREKSGKKSVLICDIFVNPTERNRGLGKFMLEWLDGKVQELGLSEIVLHAFGFNKGARHLYESFGYEITNVHMRKKL